MKRILLYICLLLQGPLLHAQKTPTTGIRIGQKCPDIHFLNLVNTTRKEYKLSDFKGETIIIDFWATWCAPCVKSLPELDKWQNKYKGKLQVILVSGEKRSVVAAFFKRAAKEHPYSLVSATDDDKLFKIFKHSYLPYTIIVDKEGFIKAIPQYGALTETKLDSLIKDQAVIIKANEDKGSVIHYQWDKPILTDTQFHFKSIYYSMFSRYNPNIGSYVSAKAKIDTINAGKISMINVSIASLYAIAFGDFGKDAHSPPSYFSSKRIVVESKDSSLIKEPKALEISEWQKAHHFSYEYVFPVENAAKAHEHMRRDIDDFFGYKAVLVKRDIDCLVLKKAGKEADALITKGGKYDLDVDFFYIKLANVPVDNLVFVLEHKFLSKQKMPVINETGFQQNIDLNIDTKPADLKQLTADLKKKGLDLVVEKRQMDFLVIKDK